MPILNYTTSIAVEKTVMEIQQVLARAGATSVNVDYDQGLPGAVTFLIEVQGYWINFRLPSNHTGVMAMLENDPSVPRKLKNSTQARRVAWRTTKNWVEAQLAIVEAQQAELVEVFLPYAIMKNGRTLFQTYKTGNLLLTKDGEG